MFYKGPNYLTLAYFDRPRDGVLQTHWDLSC